MRGADVFIDSTTSLYTVDIVEVEKRKVAREWLFKLAEAGAGATNLQVLNEVTNVLLRKAHRFDDQDPFNQVDIFSDFGTSSINLGTDAYARELHKRYHYSWWDSFCWPPRSNSAAAISFPRICRTDRMSRA